MKSIWLLKILCLKPNCDCNCEYDGRCDININKEISTFGSEYEFFIEPVIFLFTNSKSFISYLLNSVRSHREAFKDRTLSNETIAFFISRLSLLY